MKHLTKSEETLMHFLWIRKNAGLKDLLNDFPEPKPAKTTVATMLKRMTEKSFIAYNEIGSKRQYYPLVQKSSYSSKRINTLMKSFFNNSAAQLASFCTTETNLSTPELEELKSLIDKQIKKQKK